MLKASARDVPPVIPPRARERMLNRPPRMAIGREERSQTARKDLDVRDGDEVLFGMSKERKVER